ncbi:MAG: LacI family DNA-binding transcriptional regulator [Bacteroidales bacterium]|nr:LacI family DNA-binding transcriptional regulator [Bacteroidales bacterium]
MKIRIVDIARKAEVSAGTVDRYIHKRGRISESTAEKIQLAIKELGYEPDILARNLALKKHAKIICLLPNPGEIIYWERPINGIDKAIEELSSFKIEIEKLYFSPRKDSFREKSEELLKQQADGVIYAPMFIHESIQLSKELHNRNIPFFHININHPETKPVAYIGQSPSAAGQLAASLCQLKLKADQDILIAYISTEEQEYSHHQERINGFTQFFKESSSSAAINHLILKINEKGLNHESTLIDYLDKQPDIHIIFVPNSRAYRIASILKKHSIDDKFVIGFDTLQENVQFMKEGFIDILIGQQSTAQGYNAVRMMFNLLFKMEKISDTNYLPIDILNKYNIDFYERIL